LHINSYKFKPDQHGAFTHTFHTAHSSTVPKYRSTTYESGARGSAAWVEALGTRRKVAVSIPDGFIGIFH
jgi:hypothetical protein